MNTSKDQLERLLRGAAEARREAAADPIEGPSAAWLLARTSRRETIPPDVFLVFKRGLAAACLLLIATSLLAAREIRSSQPGVMSLAEAAHLQFTEALVP